MSSSYKASKHIGNAREMQVSQRPAQESADNSISTSSCYTTTEESYVGFPTHDIPTVPGTIIESSRDNVIYSSTYPSTTLLETEQPIDTGRDLFRDLHNAGSFFFNDWDSNRPPVSQFAERVLESAPTLGKLKMSSSVFDAFVPEDLFKADVYFARCKYSASELVKAYEKHRFAPSERHDTLYGFEAFLQWLTKKGLIIPSDCEYFYPFGKLIHLEDVSCPVLLSFWHRLHEKRSPLDTRPHTAICYPIRVLMVYYLASGIFGPTLPPTNWNSLSVDVSARPTSLLALKPEVRNWLEDQDYVLRETDGGPYLVNSKGPDANSFKIDMSKMSASTLFLFTDWETVLIMPWYIYTIRVVSTNKRKMYLSLSSGRSSCFFLLVLTLFKQIGMAEAVTAARNDASHPGFLWIFLLMTAQAIMTAFSHWYKTRSDDCTGGDLEEPPEMNSTLPTYTDYSRVRQQYVYKKQGCYDVPADVDADVCHHTDLPPVSETDGKMDSDPQCTITTKEHKRTIRGLNIAVVADKLAGHNSRFTRNVLKGNGEKVAEAILARGQSDQSYKDWVIEYAAKRVIPLNFLPGKYIPSVHQYYKDHPELFPVLTGQWKNCFGRIADYGRAMLPSPAQLSLIPEVSTSMIASLSDSPLVDVVLATIRFATTDWTRNLGFAGRASLTMDVSLIFYRIWKAIPSDRKDWMKFIVKSVAPGWHWQDGEAVPEKSWTDTLSGYDGVWSNARITTKMLLLRMIAFGATLPSLWNSFTTKDTWFDSVMSFCHTNKHTKAVEVVLDSMFDMFETACIMCGLGPRSAGFDAKIKPAEMSYSELAVIVQNGKTGNCSMEFYELESKLQLLKQQFSELRSVSRGLPQERHITQRLTSVEDMVRWVHGQIDAQSAHYVTKFFGFSGAAGIGKSTAVASILASCAHAIGETPNVGTLEENDAYDSNLDPNQNCLVLDDVGKTDDKHMKQPPGASVIRFSTNTKTLLLSPIADLKGAMASHHKIGVITGNQRGLSLSRGMTHWKAPARRVREFHMEIVKERSIRVDNHWQPNAQYARPIPVPTNCVFREVLWDPDGSDTAANYFLSDKVYEWEEVRDLIVADFVRHHKEQLHHTNREIDRSMCPCGDYRANCSNCSKVLQGDMFSKWVNNKLNPVCDKYFMGELAWMKELQCDDRESMKANSVFYALVFSTMSIAATVLFENFLGALIGFTIGFLFAFRAVLLSFSEIAAAFEAATMEQHVELVREGKVDSSNARKTFIGVVSISAILAAISMIRYKVKQDAADVPVDDSPVEKVQLENLSTHETVKPDDVSMTPSLEEAQSDLERYRSGDKPFLSVDEIKRLRAKAQVMHSMTENYWQAPLKANAISRAGSGTTNEHLCEMVSNQIWGMRVRVHTSAGYVWRRAIVWQIRPDHVLVTKHSLEKFPDGVAVSFLRGSREVRRVLDKSSVKEGPPGTDYAFIYTGAISGTSKNMTPYMSSTLTNSMSQAGFMVSFDWSVCKGTIESCMISICPDKTECVEPLGNSLSLKGVVSVTLNRPSKVGMCGSIYIANRTIVGMHNYGVTGFAVFNGAGGCIFDKDKVEQCFKSEPAFPNLLGPKIDYHSAKVKLSGEHPKNPSNFCFTEAPEVYTHVERAFTPRSEYKKNPFCADYEKLLGVSLEGTFGKPSDSFNKVAGKMLNVAGANRGNPRKTSIDKAVDLYLEGAEQVVDKVLEENPHLLRRFMSLHEAINGIVGHRYANGIDESKSSSFPRFSAKRNMLEGEHPNRRLKPSEQRDFDDCERAIARGDATGCVANVLRKDQPMPPGKDDRGFCGCSAEVQLAASRRLGPIMHVMQEACHFFGHVIGIDPGSTEWEMLCQRFDQCKEDKFMSLDYSAYDLTQPAELKNGAAKVFSRVGKMIGYSDEECREVELIYLEMEHMYINFGGPVVFLPSLWPSGVVPTAAGGSIKTNLMLIAGISEQWDFQVKDFRSQVEFSAMGDDNLFAERKDAMWTFDPKKLEQFCSNSGMKVTDDSKFGPLDSIHRNEVRFLKRETWVHPELGRRVGKLAKESLTRPMVMCRIKQGEHQMMIDLVNNSAREAALHGRAYYDLLMSAHKEIFQRQEWPFLPVMQVTYDDYIEIMDGRDRERKNRPFYYDLQADEDVAVVEQGIREIVEPGDVETDEGPLEWERDPTTNRTMSGDKNLPEYVKREIFISTVTLTRDIYLSSSFRPAEDIFAIPAIQERFSSYHALAFDIVVRFAVSATKYDYGRFIASFMYAPGLLDFQDEKGVNNLHHVMLMSQRHHVTFEAGQNEEAELRIPFFYHHSMLPKNSTAMRNYVEVKLESVTPPRSAVDDAPMDPTISIYARLENITTMGHTTQAYQGDILTPSEGKPKPSVVLGKIARTATAAGAVFPGLGTAAEVVAAAAGGFSAVARAFGYSTPIEVGGSPYVPFSSPPIANANADRAGRVLSMDVHQSVSLHPNIGGTGHSDQMNIDGLCNTWAIVRTGSIPMTSNGIPAPFISCNVTPCIATQFNGRYFLPPCAMVALMRGYWHGTMEYRFRVVASGLVGGKLMLAYNANTRAPPQDTHTLENVVIDLKATHEYSWSVEWHSYRNWLRTWGGTALTDPFSVSSSNPYDDGKHNGSWSVSVLQPITGVKSSTVVDYVVEARLVDARFASPDYTALSARRVYNLPNIPNAGEDPMGPGGTDGLGDFTGALDDRADDFTDGNPVRRKIDDVISSFPFPDPRRRLRLVRRETGRFGLRSIVQVGGTPAPNPPLTDAPSTAPVVSTNSPSLRAFTSMPSFQPVPAPSGAPVLSTILPVLTGAPTSVPTVPECSVYTAEVEPDYLGSNQLGRVGGNWVSSGLDIQVRTMAYGDANTGPFVEVYTDIAPTGFSASAVPIPGGARVSGATTGGGVDTVNGTLSYPSNATVTRVVVSMPGGGRVREYTPQDLAALHGWSTSQETVDGTLFDRVTVPQGDTWTPVRQSLPPSCATGAFTAIVFLYTGTLDGDNDSARTKNFRSWRWSGVTIDMNAVTETQIYAMYVFEIGPQLQGDVVANEEEYHKTFGEKQNLHDDIVALHMGEDILSLRQDLKVMREVAEVVVPASDEVSYQSILHASPSGLLGPYELLTASYAGIRGGMMAWYRLHGEGHAFVQRGLDFTSTTGSLDPDLMRGFEYADTRLNPSITVSFPWFSQSRFEYARWAFAGNQSNVRNLKAVNTGTGEMSVVESISVKEDFDLLRFLGCPLLL